MGAKIFNFAPKFSQNWGFQNQSLHLWTILDDTKNFHKCSDSPKFMGTNPPFAPRPAVSVGDRPVSDSPAVFSLPRR